VNGHHPTHAGLQKHSVGPQYPYSVQMIGDWYVIFKANSGLYMGYLGLYDYHIRTWADYSAAQSFLDSTFPNIGSFTIWLDHRFHKLPEKASTHPQRRIYS
jgi:hypothetical protein